MNLSRGKQTNISKQLNYFPLLCPANSAPNFTFPAYGSPVSFLKHPSEETCFQMSPTLTLVLNFSSMWTLTRQAYTPPPASGPPQLPPNMHSNPICSLHLSLWPTFTLALDQQCPSATAAGHHRSVHTALQIFPWPVHYTLSHLSLPLLTSVTNCSQSDS